MKSDLTSIPCSSSAGEMAPVIKKLFGNTKDGEPVYAYQLDDGKIKAEVIKLKLAFTDEFFFVQLIPEMPHKSKLLLYLFGRTEKFKFQIITYGAAIRTLHVPDSKGSFEDVVLGHDSVAGYEKGEGYLGVTVGRVANRIAKGKFSVAGKTYQLEKVVWLHGRQLSMFFL